MAGLRIALCVVLVAVCRHAAAVNEHCPAHLPKTPNLLQFGGFCYEMVLDHPGDWYHAKADCESRRGYLVDIHSFPEQAFLINSIQGGFCYKMVLDHPGDWYHAKADCESRRGYLVDIHSFPEQASLINSIQVLGIPNDKGVWIGMTDEASEGNWRWVSGVAMNFKNWAKDQPGMIGSYENCGLMEFSGTWHDYPCHGLIFTTENHGWVCKYDIMA